MKKVFYPAIFQFEVDESYTVFFPDIDGCISCGKNIEEAYEMASDALGLNLSYLEDNKQPIPIPSMPLQVKLEDGQFLVVIEFDMQAYKKKNNNKAIKKTLTIPEWLNEEAIKLGVNFSQVLQEALLSKVDSNYK